MGCNPLCKPMYNLVAGLQPPGVGAYEERLCGGEDRLPGPAWRRAATAWERARGERPGPGYPCTRALIRAASRYAARILSTRSGFVSHKARASWKTRERIRSRSPASATTRLSQNSSAGRGRYPGHRQPFRFLRPGCVESPFPCVRVRRPTGIIDRQRLLGCAR